MNLFNRSSPGRAERRQAFLKKACLVELEWRLNGRREECHSPLMKRMWQELRGPFEAAECPGFSWRIAEISRIIAFLPDLHNPWLRIFASHMTCQNFQAEAWLDLVRDEPALLGLAIQHAAWVEFKSAADSKKQLAQLILETAFAAERVRPLFQRIADFHRPYGSEWSEAVIARI